MFGCILYGPITGRGGGGGLVGSSLLYTAFHPTAVMVAYP